MYQYFVIFYCLVRFHCVPQNLFIRFPFNGHLSCFQFGAVMNKAAILYKYLYMWEKIAGYLLHFIKKYTFFKSGCTFCTPKNV